MYVHFLETKTPRADLTVVIVVQNMTIRGKN